MRVILDTNILVAAANDREEHSAAAKALLGRIADGEFEDALLHEYVFLETVTVLATRMDFASAVREGEKLLRARNVRFIQASEHFTESWQVFQEQPKGKWSFTDAALVALARAENATHIATFDKDLRRVEGLRPLP